MFLLWKKQTIIKFYKITQQLLFKKSTCLKYIVLLNILVGSVRKGRFGRKKVYCYKIIGVLLLSISENFEGLINHLLDVQGLSCVGYVSKLFEKPDQLSMIKYNLSSSFSVTHNIRLYTVNLNPPPISQYLSLSLSILILTCSPTLTSSSLSPPAFELSSHVVEDKIVPAFCQ